MGSGQVKQGLMKLEIQIESVSFFQGKYVPSTVWFSVSMFLPLQSYLLGLTAVVGREMEGSERGSEHCTGTVPGQHGTLPRAAQWSFPLS